MLSSVKTIELVQIASLKAYNAISVIASCNRSGNKDLKVVTRGQVRKRYLNTILQEKFAMGEILCSDNHISYTAFAKDKEISRNP